MNYETIRAYCLSKPATTEGLPFGPGTLVLKVADKMFALLPLDEPERLSVNLKCDPEKAEELREAYPDAILPGYHMSKKHWNTVLLNEGLQHKLVQELIDHSYQLVVDSLPKKVREAMLLGQ
jgi:predicted DNA-binding protein (MmcQ/YjbR family)